MEQDELDVLASCPSYQQACLWSLVLHAENRPHWLDQYLGVWRILVAVNDVKACRRCLREFEKENENWPPPREENVAFGLFKDRHPPTVLIVGAMLIFFGFTGEWAAHSPWFSRGAINGDQILGHNEWWRLFTALTLHADPVHVFSNVLIGGVVIHFLCKILGSGLGWFLVFFAGGLGNAMNILYQGVNHRSVGFSTAVFAAIGILSGLQIKRHQGIKGLLLPLGAGLSLLAMLGSEGERTDFGAHFCGLVSGVGAGWLLATFPAFLHWSLKPGRQLLLFLVFVGSVWGSWWLALQVT